MLTIDYGRVVHCICKHVERMNEAISWRENKLSEVLMKKLYCALVEVHGTFSITDASQAHQIMVESRHDMVRLEKV